MSTPHVASERLYYDDSYTTRFEARLAAEGEHQGHPAVELKSTFFYPESGGQEADRGVLGDVPVIDVQADDQGRVWHVLERASSGSDWTAAVDWTRRFDHMQQHTGQHILSAAFERVLGAPTVSSHLGEERGTIETPLPDMDWRMAERVELAANTIVWEDRPIELHWATDDTIGRFALRKPPPQDRSGSGGRIRIVEIPDWDVSACGGTHTRRTGEVGVVKVVRWERVRGNMRVEFLCGARAWRDYAWRAEMLVEGARRRTMKDRELVAHLERAAEERDELKKRLVEAESRLLAHEVRERVGDPPRPVSDFAPVRPRDQVRGFAIACLAAGAPWVVAAAGAPDPVVVVGRAKSLACDLKSILPGLLQRAGGKGGGSPDLIQAAASGPEAAAAAGRWAEEELATRVGKGS